MKNLIVTLISAMLATTAFAQDGRVDYNTPSPKSRVQQGLTTFDPVPGTCSYKGEVIRDECRGDPSYMRMWGVYDDPAPEYVDAFEAAFNKAAADYQNGVRTFSGTAEFCAELKVVLDRMALDESGKIECR